MNRTIWAVAGVLSASSLLLVDSAVKGTVLLALAAVAALILRRDSAATRHLVWLLAIVAMLVVPVLSAMLPQWRVLPAWMSSSRPAVVAVSSPSIVLPAGGVIESPEVAASAPRFSENIVTTGGLTPPRSPILSQSRSDSTTEHDPIVTAMEAICTQLGISRPVTLLIHPNKTIPVVWGILRCRLMLPAEARQWSDEQLRSVLLHELAHIKRRDPLLQLLAQVACALDWFNPLVWFAAWRLDVERERSCDDLVLASGIRPSAYAGHLLDVVTGHSPVRWTQSCGLAMARKSSLEGRLAAVLGKDLNRRGVSVALAGLALAIAVGVAVPIAMLRAADEKKNPPPAAQPMHKDARSLYEIWQRNDRANGDIPGGLIDELADSVKLFIKLNPNSETVPKLKEFLPRLDATHDWKSADAIALLEELAAVKDSPLSTAVWKGTKHTIRQGEALPKKFADVAWGEAQPNGLRAAWVLEPSAAEHRIGAALKARLLVQNRGPVPVILQVPTWHQGWVKASDANGAEIQASGLEWTTLAESVPVRLTPGEFIEINTPGVGLGPRAGMEPWAGPRVGSNVLAKPGDELTLTHSPVPLDGSDVGRSEDDPQVFGPGWWLAHIKARLGRELPLPADAAERTRLLDRALRELFATAPTAEETAAFTADQTPGAFDALVKRLATRADAVEFSGSLPTAPAKFRVLAADPAADKTPRVVLGPGEYPLPSVSARRGDATLKIVGRPVGDRRTNDAQLLFEATEFTGARPPDPHKLEVPDGWGTWAIVCRPSDGFFYLLHKGGARKIDFTNPRKVTDAPATDLPAEFRDEVKRQLEISGVSAESQAEVFEKPAPPAATPAAPGDGNAAARGAEAKPPEQARQWNEKYSVVAYQTQKDVSFVLVHEGFISTGLSESWSSTSGTWSINGNIHLVDTVKTKAASKNVDKRVLALKHTSDEPTKLTLDGKIYALGEGRVFVLGDEGEPFHHTKFTLAG